MLPGHLPFNTAKGMILATLTTTAAFGWPPFMPAVSTLASMAELQGDDD
jgi:hypothetical protein